MSTMFKEPGLGGFNFDFAPSDIHTPIKNPAQSPRIYSGSQMNIYSEPTHRKFFEGIATVSKIITIDEYPNYFLSECEVQFVDKPGMTIRWIRTDK